jgi:hypothetical protein
MHRHPAAALFAALTLSLAAGAASAATVKIQNRSNWDIHALYLSPVDEDEWGADQLGRNIIASGTGFSLSGVPCDAYDVRLVDEDGDVCVVGGVALCSDDVWVIDDEDLLTCQALTD